MNISYKHTLVISLLLLLPVQKDAKAQRVPTGIYAVVPVERVLAAKFYRPALPVAMNTYLEGFYTDLLNNQAVSGLTLQIHWDTLNPNPPTDAVPYDWDFVDDAFSAAQSWSANNPSKTPKTIQLIVTPGFNSSKWVRDELTSCDPLFWKMSRHFLATGCGKVTFTNFNEGGDSTELPLPWNTTYQAAWKTFLQALAAQYNGNASFVSIAVAGPTAASAEMILPHGDNEDQMQFVSHGGAVMSSNAIWKELLQVQYTDPAYLGTDQAFIDAWDNAIDTYGEVFNNVTLVATTGNGLPKFLSTAGPFPAPTSPIDFTSSCPPAGNMDCQAETTILSHFVQPSVGESNAKATQTSGLEATRTGQDYLGVVGVRYLSQQTAGSTETSQILGGAQFNSALSVNNGAEIEGGSPVVAQALFNMLQDFFTGTNAAGLYCEPSTTAPAPLNYLQIYYQDIQFASSHGAAKSVAEGCATVKISPQEELNMASQQLFEIAEP